MAARSGSTARSRDDARRTAPDRSTSTRCSPTPAPASSSAAAPAASARRPRRPRSALRAAEAGRRVVVLTIDPARRLAQSLGLTELDNTPRPVAGVGDEAGGSLHAMMLDMKRTFDEVVEAHSTPDKAAQILANPFYQSVSSSFAGTQEYMAMEKLGQLRAEAEREGTWDLIVVDTPPSRSALDFLDAPKRLGSFLDGRFIRLLTAPARAGGRAYLKVFSASARRSPRRRSPRSSAASCSPTCRPSSPPSTPCSAGSASAPTSPTPCSRSRRRPSSSSPRPSATPCARRPTSSTGWRARGCRSPASSSTGCRRSPRPP